MRKKKAHARSKPTFLIRHPQILWGLVALAAWVFEQYWHATKGEVFSPLLFAKGILLLVGACAVYQLWAFPGFSLLGMFPLLWLALSKFQWALCDSSGQRYWFWLVLLLASEIVILTVPDGKKLLCFLLPLWGLQTWLFRFSFLLPLTFLRFPEEWLAPLRRAKGWLLSERNLKVASWRGGRFSALLWLGWLGTCFLVLMMGLGLVYFFPVFLIPVFFLVSPDNRLKNQEWVGWGGLLVALALFLFFRGWKDIEMDWSRGQDFFITRYSCFFLLGWLGLGSFPKQKGYRHSSFLLFLFVLSFLFWPGAELDWSGGILVWVLIFFAGPGLESLRVNLLDPSWHGRMVWAALGLALFWGVF